MDDTGGDFAGGTKADDREINSGDAAQSGDGAEILAEVVDFRDREGGVILPDAESTLSQIDTEGEGEGDGGPEGGNTGEGASGDPEVAKERHRWVLQRAAAGGLTMYVDINIVEWMSRGAPVSFETTLLVRDCCLCLHVQRAARALARRFDEALRPVALTNGQFSMLMSLNRPRPATMTAVARLLAMDRTTLTAAVKTLERRRLVAVVRDPVDRRSRRLSLTEEGLAALGAAVPIWQRTHAEVEGLLGAGKLVDAHGLRKGLAALS
jgi:DNA-binding MarR family transcriptional regulator